MPQVTVYIREQDLDKWKALDKKSEFIHNALNQKGVVGFKGPADMDQFFKKGGTIYSPANQTKACKHGSPKGFCMHKESHRLKCNV